MLGWQALCKKEILRFWKVPLQTVGAPVLTALLYMLIFNHVLGDRMQLYGGINYVTFLIPGLIMMSILQNAIANSSSSLIQSKVMGNLIFVLLSPLSYWAWFFAYLVSSIIRGLAVGLGVLLVTFWFGPMTIQNPLWIISFAILGAGIMGALGIIAGLWAEKFDQLAAFQNFLIVPFTFLAGTFYSIDSLPAFWKTMSHLNPFFYMIDGFRYGFIGYSDTSPWMSLIVCIISFLVVSGLTLYLLKTGYKLRAS
jgi:ABC-2 type transport system permease protein